MSYDSIPCNQTSSLKLFSSIKNFNENPYKIIKDIKIHE